MGNRMNGRGVPKAMPIRYECPLCGKRGLPAFKATACGLLRTCRYCQFSETQARFEKRKLLEIGAPECGTIRMVQTNEKKFSTVIDSGKLKEWVGFGWIDLRRATEDDLLKYQRVVRRA